MCPPSSFASGDVSAQPGHSAPVPAFVGNEKISQAAYNHAASILHPSILNHSIRTYLHAKAVATRENSEWTSEARLPLLFTACIMHDIGTTAQHDGPQRFEIEGADAAATLLRGFSVPEADVHEVWVAIALHSTPGIAERITPLARIVRIAIMIEFKRPGGKPFVDEAEMEIFENEFPRLEIEKVLGDAVVGQALKQPDKAPGATWPGVMLRSKWEHPEWEGVNQAF